MSEQPHHDRWEGAKALLAEHYGECPVGCAATDIRCSRGWELAGREEEAWWHARIEHQAPSPVLAVPEAEGA